MTIAANLAAVRARIADACARAGRDPAEVELLPVSKTHPPSAILEAAASGCRRFGENKVLEARGKAAELADVGIDWVVIGHLQTNKAKAMVEFAAEFQALDSLRLAAELDRRLQAAGRGLDVLIQVNTSGEGTKSGIAPADVVDFGRRLADYASLRPRGLMTLAVNSPDEVAVRACFDDLAEARRRLRDGGVPGAWDDLSMGMSGDFELAIAAGSTCVRIGTAIFGARPD